MTIELQSPPSNFARSVIFLKFKSCMPKNQVLAERKLAVKIMNQTVKATAVFAAETRFLVINHVKTVTSHFGNEFAIVSEGGIVAVSEMEGI